MTDLSPERLEKLLEQATMPSHGFQPDPQGNYLRGVWEDADNKLRNLAPGLARQRIADAETIAELEQHVQALKLAIGSAALKDTSR